MWARLAYPNGEARDEEILTSSKGKRIRRVGKIDGTLWPFGVEKKRYTKPVSAANED